MRWNRWTWMLAAVVTGSVALAAGVLAQDRTPDAVKDRVSELFPRRELDIYPERHGQETIYEAGTGTRLEVSLDRAGNVVEVEAGVPVALVPQPARDAAREKFGADARITEGELVVRGDTLLYELEATKAGGEEKEVYVRPDGTFVKSHPG